MVRGRLGSCKKMFLGHAANQRCISASQQLECGVVSVGCARCGLRALPRCAVELLRCSVGTAAAFEDVTVAALAGRSFLMSIHTRSGLG